MTEIKTDDLRIAQIKPVVSPSQLIKEIPLTQEAATTTIKARQDIHEILSFSDDRLLVVCGPCSIHDVDVAIDYAQRLLELKEKFKDDLVIVLRVYFEKPRTTVGWKGLINDPDLNESFDINKGLYMARKLLFDLNQMGMPAGTEHLDIITPQYISDLVSWGAIGARTTESQVHRELSSGLSCPVGLKNGTKGSIDIAIDGIRAARHPHSFLSLTKEGQSAIFSTKGNPDSHIILRGGGGKTNFDADSVDHTCEKLQAAGLPEQVMIDFSHANSQKVPENQIHVCTDVSQQIASGEKRIIGVMIESHLTSGRQDVVPGQPLIYGKSITDACIDIDTTHTMLEQLANAVQKRRVANAPEAKKAVS